jgi:hypothetical protein
MNTTQTLPWVAKIAQKRPVRFALLVYVVNSTYIGNRFGMELQIALADWRSSFLLNVSSEA